MIMDLHWRIVRRTRTNRHRLTIQSRLLRITSWRQYLDIVLVLGFISALAIILGLWFGFVQWGKTRGWFDPPLVQKLEDPRILVNIRDDLASRPLLSAVYHAAEGKVFIAQKGGMIHRYDPKTRLWKTETPFVGSEYVQNTDLIFLRSGCGDDFQSPRASHCPDSRSLWGVTSSGALVRKQGRRWEILVGDTMFLGAHGEPVSQDQLTSAAISEDGRWLVLGTRGQGVGVYDLRQHSWRVLQASDFASLPSLHIRHLRFWKDRFWVGTDAGLAQLRVNTRKIEIKPVANMEGDILDLDADKRLWVLRQHACEETPDEMCLWLGAFTNPRRSPQVFLDERHRYPGLNLDALVFAQQWPERLAVAGKAGIFIYDMLRHDWRQISQRQVYLTLPLPEDEGFYFAYPGGVGLVRRDKPEKIIEWTLPDGRIAQLDYINAQPYALTEQGNLYALLESGDVLPVFRKSRTQLDPETFFEAASVGDKVILVGPEGALLHDVRLRTYDDVDKKTLPDWFTSPTARFYTTGTHIFVVEDANDAQVVIHQFDAAHLQTVTDLQSAAADASTWTFPGPLREATAWQDGSLYALVGDGSAYLLAGSQRTRWIGPARSQMSVQDFLDVIEMDDGLLISTRNGLRLYDYRRRDWGDFRRPPADTHVLDFARWQGKLYMRTDAQRLVQDDEHAPVLIGDVEGFPFDDEAITDVLLKGDALYLAGPNVAIRYSLEQRRLVEQWDLQAANNPRLIGILDDVPLTLGDGALYVGAQLLDPDAGQALSASLGDDAIWTVRQENGIRYLKRYDASAPASGKTACWFRTPIAQHATDIFDAQKLPNGLVAVATDVGLFLYDPGARTWHATDLTYASARSRLYRLGDYLVFIYGEAEDITVVIIPLQTIPAPHSCSTRVVSLPSQKIHARAVAVDPPRKSFAYLESEGRVRLWQNGSQQTVLESPGIAPGGSFRRVYRVDDFLFFTTDDSLWRYDLQQRYWREIKLAGAPVDAAVANMDLFQEGQRLTLLVHRQDGGILYGEFDVDGLNVNLRPLFSPMSPFNAPGQTLLDAQQWSANLWTFVLTSGVTYFDPVQRTWQPGFQLDQPDVTLRYQMTPNERGVLVGRNGQTWWVARRRGDGVTDFARFNLLPDHRHALDENGDIWALGPEGRLQHCSPQGTDYACQPENKPALFLNPSAMRHAYDWEGFHLLETDQGLHLYDASGHQEIPLPGKLTILASLQEVREGPDRTLWLWDGDTLAVLARAGNEVRLQALEEVASQVVFDEDGTPWANIDHQWVYWHDGEFRAPPGAPSGAMFVMERARPAAMDASNTLYSWDGRQFKPYALSLPLSLHGADVRGLWPVAEGAWWIQIGEHEMALLTTDLCTPTPAPVTTSPMTPTSPITTTTPITGAQPPAPAPTPTPEPVPCMQIQTRLTAPAAPPLPPSADVVAVEATRKSLLLFARDGRVWHFDAMGQRATTSTQTPPLPSRSLEDQWPGWRDHFGQTPNGQWAYDPITDIRLDSKGELVAKRSLDDMVLAQAGYFQFTEPPALDVDWLQWQREDHAFVLRTPGGQVRYSPEAFIQQGEMLFEPVEAILARKGGRLVAANRYGLWYYPSFHLRLDDPKIRFQPVDLHPPIQAAHGRFMAQNGDVLPESDRIEPPLAIHRVAFDDVVLEEGLRLGSIQGSYSLAGQWTDAFTPEGFLWDAHRKALAFHHGQLFIQDAAGIHPIDSYAHFDPGPIKGLDGVRIFDEQGAMYVQANTTYYRREDSGWHAIPAHPASSRLLYQDQVWQWELDDWTFRATLDGPGYQFAYRITPEGAGFTSDKLQAATFARDSLFVMSDAFFEVGNAQALTRRTAVRYSPSPTDKLETITMASSPTVFRTLGEEVFQWDTTQKQFVLTSPDRNPYRFRELARTSRLRFLLEQGRVVQEVRLDRLDGESLWTRFSFVNRRFPFDVVTTLAADKERLYVGTAAGLLVYDSPTSWSLDHSAQIMDMRGASTGPPQAVIRAGRPVRVPDRLVFESQSMCYHVSPSASLRLCDDASLSAQRTLRGATPGWRWVREDGALQGAYRDALTDTYTLPVDLSTGRFPHDRLRQTMLCQGRALSLWENDWFTLHASDAIPLDAQTRHFDLTSLAPDRLFCVKRPTWRDGVRISPGAYLHARADEMYHLEGQHWRRVEDAGEAASLRDVMARPAIYEQGRLRLLQPSPQTPFLFEQRTLDQRWHRLTWQEGHLPIDEWTAFIQVKDQLWGATREGWMPFSLDDVPQAVIAPEQLVIVREPKTEKGDVCFVTDVMTRDEEVLLRCQGDSRQVYQGVLSLSQDRDVFAGRDEDPFRETLFISSDFWTWRREGRTMGAPGALTVTWRDEPLTLINGRFPFDGVTSLALIWPESVEWVARGGGWYQFERERSSLSPKDLRRPQNGEVDPSQVLDFGVTYEGGFDENHRQLCLQMQDDQTLFITYRYEVQPTSVCRRYQAHDTLWTYQREGEQLVILPQRAIGGVGERMLQRGRFADDWVMAPPATGLEGEETRYFVPTRAGVLVFDDSMQVRAIHVGEFPGLDRAEMPRSLLTVGAGEPAYVATDGLYRLDETRSVLPGPWPWPAQLTSPPHVASFGPLDNTMQWTWHEARGVSSWLLTPAGVGEWTLAVDLFPLSRYQQLLNQRAGLPRWIYVTPEKGALSFQFDGQRVRYEPWEGDLERLVAAVSIPGAALFIQQDDIFEVHFERLLSEKQAP